MSNIEAGHGAQGEPADGVFGHTSHETPGLDHRIRMTVSNTEGDDFRMNRSTVAIDSELIKVRITATDKLTSDPPALRAFILAKLDQFRVDVERALGTL